MNYDLEELCWQPGIKDEDLNHYLQASRSLAAVYGMQVSPNYEFDDGALVMATRDDTTIRSMETLARNGMNVRNSLEELLKDPVPQPITQKWNEDDVKAFTKGLRTLGKNFFRIRNEFLQEKDVCDLVEFYYLWKKTPEGLANRPHRSARRRQAIAPVPRRVNVLTEPKSENGKEGRDSPLSHTQDEYDSSEFGNNSSTSSSSSDDEETLDFKKYAYMPESWKSVLSTPKDEKPVKRKRRKTGLKQEKETIPTPKSPPKILDSPNSRNKRKRPSLIVTKEKSDDEVVNQADTEDNEEEEKQNFSDASKSESADTKSQEAPLPTENPNLPNPYPTPPLEKIEMEVDQVQQPVVPQAPVPQVPVPQMKTERVTEIQNVVKNPQTPPNFTKVTPPPGSNLQPPPIVKTEAVEVKKEEPIEEPPKVEIKTEAETIAPEVKEPPKPEPSQLQIPRNSGKPTWTQENVKGDCQPVLHTIERDPEEPPEPYQRPKTPLESQKILNRPPKPTQTNQKEIHTYIFLWERGPDSCARSDIIFSPCPESKFALKRKKKEAERAYKEQTARLQRTQEELNKQVVTNIKQPTESVQQPSRPASAMSQASQRSTQPKPNQITNPMASPRHNLQNAQNKVSPQVARSNTPQNRSGPSPFGAGPIPGQLNQPARVNSQNSATGRASTDLNNQQQMMQLLAQQGNQGAQQALLQQIQQQQQLEAQTTLAQSQAAHQRQLQYTLHQQQINNIYNQIKQVQQNKQNLHQQIELWKRGVKFLLKNIQNLF